MIRFLIDQFRNAPGPLKKPRILTADLAEELLDLAEHFLKKGDSRVGQSPCGHSPCSDATSASAPTAASSAAAVSPSPSETLAGSPVVATPASVKTPESNYSVELDARLFAAMHIPANVRKQEFKVLAILWDAKQKEIGALSAKAISRRGEDLLKIQIRHENVRKVIRMRLENYVKVHAQGVGNGTVYNYELSEAGAEYFVSTYLK
ncbi:MAG: hypothetical protein JXR76_19570 [Deltaproteobacteria bacterium]|nr:hypothetical protein [Deltaproteobacteria bacterium]